MSRSRQQGMALLAVLLLVAVMTVLIVAMLDDVRFGQRRTGNSAAIAQARHVVLVLFDGLGNRQLDTLIPGGAIVHSRRTALRSASKTKKPPPEATMGRQPARWVWTAKSISFIVTKESIRSSIDHS